MAFLLVFAQCTSTDDTISRKEGRGEDSDGSPPIRQAPPQPQFPTSRIVVDAGAVTGTIRNTADLNWYYDPDYEIQPRYIRTWCLTGWLPSKKAIFKDLTADPDNPSNYSWSDLDARLARYAKHKAKPYILLSIAPPEIAKIKKGERTPQWLIDNRWTIARSMARILYHITSSDRAWGGLGLQVEYVELWNEPCAMDSWVDPFKHWPLRMYGRKSYECFVDIIERTIADIRKLCGKEMKVGAWGGQPFIDDVLDKSLLDVMSRRRVPLDFYSWHDYRYPPDMWNFTLLRNRVTETRNKLKSKGYAIPQHITEWNNFEWVINGRLNYWYRTIQSAAHTAEYLIHAQDLPVVVMHRWNGGKDPFGLWNESGSHRYPVFYTYTLFRNLLGNRRLKTDAGDYCVLAGKRGNKINILIACDEYNNSKDGYHLIVDDVSSNFSYTITEVTEQKYHGGIKIIQSGRGESVLDIKVPTEKYAVHLVEIQPG